MHIVHNPLVYSVVLGESVKRNDFSNVPSPFAFRIFGASVELLPGIISSMPYRHQGMAFRTKNRHFSLHEKGFSAR